RTRWLHHPAASGRAGGGHDALSESHVRCRKGFRHNRAYQYCSSHAAARPTLPPNNFKEFLRWMREPGQNIKVGHPGVGSFGHLADVLIVQELGMKVTQVPYRGAGPALVDLLAGQVDLGPISAVVAGPLVRTGKLKAYAIIGRNRFAGLPELKT